jgi:hypothetical protein
LSPTSTLARTDDPGQDRSYGADGLRYRITDEPNPTERRCSASRTATSEPVDNLLRCPRPASGGEALRLSHDPRREGSLLEPTEVNPIRIRQIALALSLAATTAMLASCGGSSGTKLEAPATTSTPTTTTAATTQEPVAFVSGRCWLKIRAQINDGADSGVVFSYRMKVTVTPSRLSGSEVKKNRKGRASVYGEVMGDTLALSLYPPDYDRIAGTLAPFAGCANTPPVHGEFQGPGQTDFGELSIVRTTGR